MLRGDVVKDDSGSYAVFTEQGSSAPQMAASKVMVDFARRPGCTGQAADAVFSLHPCQNVNAEHRVARTFFSVSRT